MSRPLNIVSRGRCDELRKHVRLYTKAKGITVTAFGRQAGIGSGTFSAFLNGRALRPENEVKIARALGLAPSATVVVTAARLPGEKTLMMSAEDLDKVRAIIREAQGEGSLMALQIRLGTGLTAMHGFMRGAAGMSAEMANRTMAKLGRPERFQGTVPRKVGKRADLAPLRVRVQRYVDEHHGGVVSRATHDLDVSQSALSSFMHQGRGLKPATIARIEKALDGAPSPRARGHAHPHHHHPVADKRQLVLPMNGHAMEVARPDKISVDALLGNRIRPPVETSVKALVARWQREAFALVCHLAQQEENEPT